VRTDAELREAIRGYDWYHSIELRPGIVTPGRAAERNVLPFLGIPGDLSGKTVLDIGCWDGFFSFECERRGAKRVVATDIWETLGRDAFDFARAELGSSVEPVQASVYALPDVLGGERFDLVLFLGVLYHLRHPLLGIEKVAEVTAPGGLAVVETAVDAETLMDRPLMAFYPGDELNHDPTNWWTPNVPALASMLSVSGFGEVVSRVQLYGGNRSVFHAVKMSDAEREKQARREYLDRHLGRRLGARGA
jgi:tRNA (mo5U34)-methyltransferase